MNHAGAGIMNAAATPPARNSTPITQANTALWLPATSQATNAPANVPNACARKGIRKCFGSSSWMPAASPSAVVMSTPAGGGTSTGPKAMRPMLTALPTTNPATTAAMFRNQCFMSPSPLGARLRDGGSMRLSQSKASAIFRPADTGGGYTSRMDTIALINSYYDAFNRADWEGMLALLTDDVAHDLNQGARETGREAFRTFLARMDRSYSEQLRDITVMAV